MCDGLDEELRDEAGDRCADEISFDDGGSVAPRRSYGRKAVFGICRSMLCPNGNCGMRFGCGNCGGVVDARLVGDEPGFTLKNSFGAPGTDGVIPGAPAKKEGKKSLN